MSSDNFDEIAWEIVAKNCEQTQRIDNGDAVSPTKTLSPIAQLQQEDSAVARFSKYLDNASFHDESLEVGAKPEQVAAKWQLRHLAAAEAGAVAKRELTLAATAAARSYLEAQAEFWNEMAVASRMAVDKILTVSPQPASFTIKARIPRVRISIEGEQEYVPAPAAEPKIEMPPVHWLASALDFLLTKGAFKRTVEPILVDIYDEYFELISSGDERRAKWVVARGCLLVIWGQIARPLVAVSEWWGSLRG
jgi:hypothetical protein